MNTDNTLTERNIENIIENLVQHGLAVLPNFLDQQLTTDLYEHIVDLIRRSTLTQASIGREKDVQLNHAIRSDKTHWIDGSDDCERHYLDLMDQLRLQLNRQLYLGLNDYECHFAHYEAGDSYERHLDAFKGKSNRIVTTVFYLNPDWQQQDGGELIVYKPNSPEDIQTKVSPQFGTLVIFMSEDFPHEVLPAQRDRYSISGWFRIDKAGL